MSEPRQPLGRVVVVGAGQVGILAAIGSKRAVPSCEVMVIAGETAAGDFADLSPGALPFTNRLHERLGIEEAGIVQRAGGSHRLIERMFGWGEEGEHGVLSYGEAQMQGAAQFGRDWGGGSRSETGEALPGSFAELLADAGRFRLAEPGERSPLASLEYGLRWNVAAYRALLIEQAQRLGIVYSEAPVGEVRPGDKGIASLTLASGEAIAADLYLDCSGTARRVVSRIPHTVLYPWEEAAGRQLLFANPAEPMLALEDRLTLTRHGWIREVAGRDGLHQLLCLSSGEVSTEQACAQLQFQPALHMPVVSGALSQCWAGNVVALGDAAAQFEPVLNLNLDLAHRMIALLLEMLPGARIEDSERREFNRRAALMVQGVRDTIALLYQAPQARRVSRQHEQSASVAKTIDQFTRRGRLPFFEEQPFAAAEKMRLLAALGFAQGTPPQHAAAPTLSRRGQFEEQARAMLASVPPYADWMSAQMRG